MNTYAFLIKAKAKSDKKNLFCWCSAKSDLRAEREIANILEDAEIEVGRGADYNLPIRTDWFVVDDLPEEGKLDDTWCDRYELNDDSKSWRHITRIGAASVNIQEDHAATTQQASSEVAIKNATFNQHVLAGWLFGAFSSDGQLSQGQVAEIATLQHDMDATYSQNLLLALNNAKDLLQLQHCYPETLFDLIDSIKSIWSPEGKAPEVGNLVTFSKEWINAHNNQSSSPDGPFREDITAKWISKQGMQRTESGANAGGNAVTDRDPNYKHTLDTLDVEIALATLPFDFDIYNLPGPVYRRAKEIAVKKEEPFRTWSAKLRTMPGILDVSRAGIIALIRSAADNITHFPDSMQRRINSTLTADYYTAPTPALLALARHTPINPGTPENVAQVWADAEAVLATPANADSQPEIKNVGNGVFSIDGLKKPASNEGEKTEVQAEGGTNVQMEAVDGQQIETGVAVSQDEKNDVVHSSPIDEARVSLESRVMTIEKVIFHLRALITAVQSVSQQNEITGGGCH